MEMSVGLSRRRQSPWHGFWEGGRGNERANTGQPGFTSGFQNDPFWGVLSKTSALRYVWRKTALQIQCNPPQPRAKHTTPRHVIIVIWHHAHNNFFFHMILF